MLWMLSAFAGPTTVLVGVDQLPPDLPVAPRACFASSMVCLVEGTTPEALRGLRGVRHAAWDAPMQLAAGPSLTPTSDCPDLHELQSTGVEAAWLDAYGVAAPVVAVQDAGFLTSHEDLVGRIAGGYDHGDGDADPEVTSGAGVIEAHGTFIAGVIAANADAVGRVGVVPEGQLYLQKIADSGGALFFSYAIEAMDDLVLNHPEVGVLNYSIASTNPPQAFADAVAALGNADIVVVTAAANCGVPNCFDADNDAYPVYPSSYTDDHVISVASLRPTGALDPYSHYGATSVEVAAPGGNVCSLGVGADDDYLVASGTSYATPVVAGVVALVREAFPRLTAPEVTELICASADPTAEVAGKVACGVAKADDALAVPVVRFGEVPPLDAVGVTAWVVPIDSLAASTDATLTVSLPKGMTVAGGQVVTLLLPRDALEEVALVVEATADVSGTGTLTLELANGEVHEVSVAVTGAPGVDSADTGVPSTETADTGGPTDTDDTDDTDDTQTTTDTAATTPDPEPPGTSAGALSGEKGGCGCQSGGSVGGWMLPALVALRRRR